MFKSPHRFQSIALSSFLIVLSTSGLGCRAPADVSLTTQTTTVRATIAIPGLGPGTPTRLVMWWERPDERREGQLDFHLFGQLISRMRVVDTFVSGEGAHGNGQNGRLRAAFEYMVERFPR
jgi:hypothetical protein